MKTLILTIGFMLVGMSAKAETLAVTFLWCSNNDQYVCAKVYSNGFNGEEMAVNSSGEELDMQIQRTILRHGRSLARNIDGKVKKVTGFGGRIYYTLDVYNLEGDPNAPRPRGFGRQ